MSYTQEPRAVERAPSEPAEVMHAVPRQRTKRKGWEVVARIENRKGQRVAIYQPLLDAVLAGGTSEEQHSRVRAVLRGNGNDPTAASVNYYLANTRDYLASQEVVGQ